MITLIYTGHFEEDLTPEIEAVIRSSDIYVNETLRDYRKVGYEKMFNDVSQGLVNPDDIQPVGDSNKWATRELKMIYKSGVKVRSERRESYEESERADKTMVEVREFFCRGNTRQALEKSKEYFKLEASLAENRDMELVDFLISLQSSDKNASITCLRGAGHTLLYHLLKRKDIDVRRIFPHMPYKLDMKTEILRRITFGEKVDDVSLLQSCAFNEIYISYFAKITPSFSEAMDRTDEVARQLTEDKVTDLSRRISENWWPKMGKDIEGVMFGIIDDWMAENGFS